MYTITLSTLSTIESTYGRDCSNIDRGRKRECSNIDRMTQVMLPHSALAGDELTKNNALLVMMKHVRFSRVHIGIGMFRSRPSSTEQNTQVIKG